MTFVDLHFTPDGAVAGQPDHAGAMPIPKPKKFPICSIIRPTATKGAAMGAVKALTADGLFIGQTDAFTDLITDLAADADRAEREFEGEF